VYDSYVLKTEQEKKLLMIDMVYRIAPLLMTLIDLQ